MVLYLGCVLYLDIPEKKKQTGMRGGGRGSWGYGISKGTAEIASG